MSIRRHDRPDISEGPPNGDQHGCRKKGARGRLIDRTTGAMNTKLQAICDGHSRPIGLFITAGQVSDCVSAWPLLGGQPKARWLPGRSAKPQSNMTSDATALRSCPAGSRAGGVWRPAMIAAPTVFSSAFALATIVIYWLWILS